MSILEQHFPCTLAVLLKKISPVVLGTGNTQRQATYFALGLVDPVTKSGANGLI